MSILLEGHEQGHPQIHQQLCIVQERKDKTQAYPLCMTDIPDRPFDKIAIDLVSDLNISASGNQH